MTCLKYLLPISCALLLGVSVWQLIFPGGVLPVTPVPGWWNAAGAAVAVDGR
jgi:hypothetical protein